MVLILKSMMIAGTATGALKKNDLNTVTVPRSRRAVTFPIDAKLLNRICEHLVKTRTACLKLRQSFVRVGPKRLSKVNRYAHVLQMERMKREVKILRTILGRVLPNMEQKAGQIVNPCVQQLKEMYMAEELKLDKRVMEQERTCKDNAHKRHEFGLKLGVSVTNRRNFAVNSLPFSGNLCDSNRLFDMLCQVDWTTRDKTIKVFVDRVYRGHYVTDSQVFISSQKGSVTARLRHLFKQRQAIEPMVDQVRRFGNYMKGIESSWINAMLSYAGTKCV